MNSWQNQSCWEKLPGNKDKEAEERLPLEGSTSLEVSLRGKHVVGEALRAAAFLGTAGGRAAPEGHGTSRHCHPNRVTPSRLSSRESLTRGTHPALLPHMALTRRRRGF